MSTPEARLSALQAVSRLRQAEAAEIASEASQGVPSGDGSDFWDSIDPAKSWGPKEWADWSAWCDREDARAVQTDEELAEQDRYAMARSTRINPHDD